MKLNVIDKYILVIDEVIDPAVCDVIIKRFEKDTHLHERKITEQNSRHFDQINVSADRGWQDVHKLLIEKAYECAEVYRKTFEIKPFMWPEPYTFEQIRMKRYHNDGVDGFGDHVDAGNLETVHRFLTYLWYLNDVEEGGETQFTRYGDGDRYKVKPKQGSILMFPPIWTYPHLAAKPISGPKYIIGGHLQHHIPEGAVMKAVNGVANWY